MDSGVTCSSDSPPGYGGSSGLVEPGEDLEVVGVREHVEGVQLLDEVTGGCERGEIASEAHGIAGDQRDAARAQLGDAPGGVAQTGAWRIDDHQIEAWL